MLKFWTLQESSSLPQTMPSIQDTTEADHTRPHLKWGTVNLAHFCSGTRARKPSSMPLRQRRLRSPRGTPRGKAHQSSHSKDNARIISGMGMAPLFLFSCPLPMPIHLSMYLPGHLSMHLHIHLPSSHAHPPLAVSNAVIGGFFTSSVLGSTVCLGGERLALQTHLSISSCEPHTSTGEAVSEFIFETCLSKNTWFAL